MARLKPRTFKTLKPRPFKTMTFPQPVKACPSVPTRFVAGLAAPGAYGYQTYAGDQGNGAEDG